MATIAFHKTNNPEIIAHERANLFFELPHAERIKKAFGLMKLSLLFKKSNIKQPQAKGIVLKFK
jgi:hypothetical protein